MKNLFPPTTFVRMMSSKAKKMTRDLVEKEKAKKRLGSCCLFVGEANFSFTHQMIDQDLVVPKDVISTAFESKAAEESESTIKVLEDAGVTVEHGVDATQLKSHHLIGKRSFDHIQFNYPHHVSQGPMNAEPHRHLIGEFFSEAQPLLKEGGRVRVLHPLNEPYHFGWNITKLARQAGFKSMVHTDFNMSAYPLYKPKKGFGKKPNDPVETRVSLFYDFFLDETKGVPLTEETDIKGPAEEVAQENSDIKPPGEEGAQENSDIKAPGEEVAQENSDIKPPGEEGAQENSDIKAPEEEVAQENSDIKPPGEEVAQENSDIKPLGEEVAQENSNN